MKVLWWMAFAIKHRAAEARTRWKPFWPRHQCIFGQHNSVPAKISWDIWSRIIILGSGENCFAACWEINHAKTAVEPLKVITKILTRSYTGWEHVDKEGVLIFALYVVASACIWKANLMKEPIDQTFVLLPILFLDVDFGILGFTLLDFFSKPFGQKCLLK